MTYLERLPDEVLSDVVHYALFHESVPYHLTESMRRTALREGCTPDMRAEHLLIDAALREAARRWCVGRGIKKAESEDPASTTKHQERNRKVPDPS